MRLRLQIGALAALILGLWAAYAFLLGPRVGWGPAVLLGLLGSLFLLLLVSGVLGVIRSLLKLRLLAGAEKGPLRQDGFLVWSGQAVAVAEPDKAPLSGVDCLIWEYEMEEARGGPGGNQNEVREWSGIGQAPMAIESAHGRASVRCGVLTENLPWRRPKKSECEERARRLASRTDARSASGLLDFTSMLSDLEQHMNDADGAARLDWRRGRAGAPAGLANLRERRVEPGDEVTAFGWFSLSERAFVPSRRGLELYPCSASLLRSSLLKSRFGVLAFGLFTNTLIQGLVILAYVRAPV